MQSIKGFTLVEVMIALVIVGVLAAMVIPSYQGYMNQSRRSDAMTMLSEASNRQERLLTQGGSYTTDTGLLGGAESENQMYQLTVSVDATNVATPAPGSVTSIDISCNQDPCYIVAATVQGNQVGDTDCSHYTLDHLGRKRSYDSSGNMNATGTNDPCW